MNRRQFIHTSAGLSSSAAAYAEQAADQKPKRVGLIGSGWYGKTDLFRLIQVSPVEVVSLCDVDKHMLSDAADLVASRQASKRSRAPIPITARCSRRKISTSSSSALPTTGTRSP